MSANAFIWGGMLSMMFISVMLMLIVLPVVNEWEDDWREYAAETAFGGPCAEDPTLPECGGGWMPERWQLVPWMLTVGYAASLLALCLPFDKELSRGNGPGPGRARRFWNFIREQR